MDFWSEKRQVTDLVETAFGQTAGWAANDRLHGAHARLKRSSVVCIQTGALSTMHVQVFTLNGCCVHQRTHLRTLSLQYVRMHSCMRSFFI